MSDRVELGYGGGGGRVIELAVGDRTGPDRLEVFAQGLLDGFVGGAGLEGVEDPACSVDASWESVRPTPMVCRSRWTWRAQRLCELHDEGVVGMPHHRDVEAPVRIEVAAIAGDPLAAGQRLLGRVDVGDHLLVSLVGPAKDGMSVSLRRRAWSSAPSSTMARASRSWPICSALNGGATR